MTSHEPIFIIAWTDTGQEAQQAPDPRYPEGIHMDSTQGAPGCLFRLPWPAPRVGAWIVQCNACGMSVGVSAAGRPDDPRSVRLPCKGREEKADA